MSDAMGTLRKYRAKLVRVRAAYQIKAELNTIRSITELCQAEGIDPRSWIRP